MIRRRLAHVHPKGSLLNDDVRPNIIDEFFLSDDLAGTLGEVDQNVQRPAAVLPARPIRQRVMLPVFELGPECR
jgi:hypothetical protein